MSNEVQYDEMLSVLVEAFHAFNKSADKLNKAYNQLSQDTINDTKTIKTASYYSSALFDLICGSLECLKDGIIILDRSGRVIYFNQAAQEIVKLGSFDVIGNHYGTIFNNNHFMESIESGVEKHYRRQFDSEEEFDVFIKPIKGEYGRIIGALEILSHSEQVSSYSQRQESDYITKLVKVMGDVVMNIVHQMRSPLGAIQLFAEILKEDLDNDKADMVDEILASVYSLDAVLSNLLSSVQPLTPSIQKVDFINIIEESLAFSAPAIRQQNIKLTRDFTNDHLYCYGDIEQLKQVCFNLILNAIQAMSEGGDLIIRASYVDDMKNIYIEIDDNGCGIPNELIDRIFTPFFTTKEGGTGLGLYVVYRIIQAHKGKIEIKSIEEVGTKINIKLPS